MVGYVLIGETHADAWRSSRSEIGKLTFELRFDPKAKYKNVSLIFFLENFLLE